MARYSFPFQSTTRNHHAWSRSLIADALSVPVSWVLLAELCTLAFLAPTSLLYTAKTLPLYTKPWALILHLGPHRRVAWWAPTARCSARLNFGSMTGKSQQPKHHMKRRWRQQKNMVLKRSDHASHHLSHAYGLDKWFRRWSGGPFEAQVFLTWISQESSQWRNLQTQLVWDKVTVKDRTTVLVDARPSSASVEQCTWKSLCSPLGKQTRWACESSCCSCMEDPGSFLGAIEKCMPEASCRVHRAWIVLFPDASRFSHGGSS